MPAFRDKIALVAAFSAAFFWAAVGMGSAEELMSQRLEAIVGQQRATLSDLAPDQLASIAASSPRGNAEGASDPMFTQGYLDTLPDASGDKEWECLAETIYFEARGESVEGMFAVGEVVLNRVASSAFPGSICRVVNQGTGARYQCQFSYTCDGKAETIGDRTTYGMIGKIARLLIDGQAPDIVNGATYYHARGVNPSWSRRFDQVASIGNHLFYAPPLQTASN